VTFARETIDRHRNNFVTPANQTWRK